MFVASGMQDYQLYDTGEGMKLESWAGIWLSRPDPQAIWKKQCPGKWEKAAAVYRRSSAGGGHWEYKRKLPERWEVEIGGLRFYVRPTGFKHTGLFPEQSCNWAFIREHTAPGDRVLNLFAYTGGATLAAAAAGAEVAHVDAAKGMVAWARENAALSGLSDRPIRYIVDDCLKFVKREQRRGRQYEGIIMDPPSYGRGSGGEVWKLEDSIAELVEEAAKLLSPRAKFFLLSSYTTGLSAVVTGNLLEQYVRSRLGGRIEADTLAIPVEQSRLYLPCGTTARWMREEA